MFHRNILSPSSESKSTPNKQQARSLMSHHQNEDKNINIKIPNRSYEEAEEGANFRCFRMTLSNQNAIHDEIISRLISDNASYLSFS
jgi:hypothetical protein